MPKIANPFIVIVGGKPNFMRYNVQQVINDDLCEINITDITTQTTNNYFVGANVQNDTQQLYIVDI